MDLATISLALTLSSPHMPHGVVTWYASILHDREKHLHINPLIEISIAEHESQWNSSLISSDGEDYGLMQIRAKYYSASDPIRLLNGGNNLYLGAGIMKANYNFCYKKLGREPETQEWLSCFQGSCRTPKRTCKPTKLTYVVEKYAQCLEEELIELVSKDCNKYSGYDIN